MQTNEIPTSAPGDRAPTSEEPAPIKMTNQQAELEQAAVCAANELNLCTNLPCARSQPSSLLYTPNLLCTPVRCMIITCMPLAHVHPIRHPTPSPPPPLLGARPEVHTSVLPRSSRRSWRARRTPRTSRVARSTPRTCRLSPRTHTHRSCISIPSCSLSLALS